MTASDVFNLRLSKDGRPWVRISLNRTLDFNSLKYSKDGTPWWGIQGVSTMIFNSGHIKRVIKVDYPNVNAIIGVE